MDTGDFSHPGYPANYTNNVDSTWEIAADPGKTILLRFNAFALQPDSNCQYDYVEVYDGDESTGQLIGKYCNGKPGVIRSTGNTLTVVFHSDGSVVDTGFSASWSTSQKNPPGIFLFSHFTPFPHSDGHVVPLSIN